jgi:hypothetical protein
MDKEPFIPPSIIGLIVAIICLLMVIGCTQTGNITSAMGQPPASVDSQLVSGARIYAQTCATSTCHGTQGEGIRSGNSFSVWPLVGPDFQTRHPTAEIVFDVVRSGDEANLRALTDQQIYDSIAYELEQNQITLTSPLTAANAQKAYGGSMSGVIQNGLFPPPTGILLSSTSSTISLPRGTDNGNLRLQLDQLAEANAIGDTKPPIGGAFLTMVFAVTDLEQTPISINPDNLRLSTTSGDSLKQEAINAHSAIEQFHAETIMPLHGTAALVVFTLSNSDQPDQLIYDDQAGNRLMLELRP